MAGGHAPCGNGRATIFWRPDGTTIRAYLRPYGAAPPDGDWAYIVDDDGITYGPGWWPYHRDGKPGTVRVSPNTEFRSWRNEYVLISPSLTEPATAVARLHLFVRPQGMGAMTVVARIGVDIRQTHL